MLYFAMIEILAATVVAQTNRPFFFFCFCEAHGLVTNAYGTMGGETALEKPKAKR